MQEKKLITICYGGDWKPKYIILSKCGWMPYRLQWAFSQRKFDNCEYAEKVGKRAIKLWLLNDSDLLTVNDNTGELEIITT